MTVFQPAQSTIDGLKSSMRGSKEASVHFEKAIEVLAKNANPDEIERVASFFNHATGCLQNLADQAKEFQAEQREIKRRERNRKARQRRNEKIAATPFSQIIKNKLP